MQGGRPPDSTRLVPPGAAGPVLGGRAPVPGACGAWAQHHEVPGQGARPVEPEAPAPCRRVAGSRRADWASASGWAVRPSRPVRGEAGLRGTERAPPGAERGLPLLPSAHVAGPGAGSGHAQGQCTKCDAIFYFYIYLQVIFLLLLTVVCKRKYLPSFPCGSPHPGSRLPAPGAIAGPGSAPPARARPVSRRGCLPRGPRRPGPPTRMPSGDDWSWQTRSVADTHRPSPGRPGQLCPRASRARACLSRWHMDGGWRCTPTGGGLLAGLCDLPRGHHGRTGRGQQRPRSPPERQPTRPTGCAPQTSKESLLAPRAPLPPTDDRRVRSPGPGTVPCSPPVACAGSMPTSVPRVLGSQRPPRPRSPLGAPGRGRVLTRVSRRLARPPRGTRSTFST